MGSRTRPPKFGRRAQSAWLRGRVEAAFGFLVAERGFIGPEVHDAGLTYHSPNVAIDILYDEREQSVEALACREVGETYICARLSCLIVEAHLGAAQDVKTAARTTHALDLALASQADVLRRLLIPLEGDARDDLMRACHAR